MIEVWFVIDGESLVDQRERYADIASAYEDAARIHNRLLRQGTSSDIQVVIKSMPACRGLCGKLLSYPDTTYCEYCAAVHARIERATQSPPPALVHFGFVHDEENLDCQCARCMYDVDGLPHTASG